MNTIPPTPPAARPRILVIDDDESTRSALAQWLSYEYDVVTAKDGIDGLEAATVMTRPDVILADVWMPRLDGVTMIRRIKAIEALRRVPVIFLTGQTSVHSVVAGIAAGAWAYLPKPVNLDVLDLKLRSALRHAGTVPPPAREP